MKKHIIIGVLAIILLSGCSASNLIRRAKRKDPSIFSVKIDTVIDTVFKYNFDTVEYWQDKVFIKYHYDTLTNNVFIEADCPDQEIITEYIKKSEVVTLEPTLKDKLLGGVYIGLGVLSFFIIGYFINKFL